MVTIHVVTGVTLLVVNLAAGLLGAWCWYRVEPSPRFWILLRTGQATIVVQVVLGGLLLALGTSRATTCTSSTERCRSSCRSWPSSCGSARPTRSSPRAAYDSAADVGELPADEQRVVVLSIVRREMGVMTVSCLVVVALALRAATTSGF